MAILLNLVKSIYDYMGQQNLNSMFINPVNEAEVIPIIKLCKPIKIQWTMMT